MDDREYRKLARFARKAVIEMDATEYRSGACQLPQPQDFGLSASDVDRIKRHSHLFFAGLVWVGGIALLGLMAWAAYSWLRPVASIEGWLTVAAIGLFLTAFAGTGLFMVAAVVSLALTPVLRQLVPKYVALRDYEDAVAQFHDWERRTHRAHWLALTPVEFEREVAALYKRLGYEVALMPTSGDKGIDIVLARAGVITVVQCKAHERPIGPGVARELIGTLVLHGPASGVIVSRSGFTSGVRELAASAGVELVDLDQVLSQHHNASCSPTGGRAV